MAKPTTVPGWANNLVQETKLIDGILQDVPNKVDIPTEIQGTGVVYEEYVDRQLLNQILYELCQWAGYVNTIYGVGDVHLTASAEDATAISARLGGTWVANGTINSYNVFEKTA